MAQRWTGAPGPAAVATAVPAEATGGRAPDGEREGHDTAAPAPGPPDRVLPRVALASTLVPLLVSAIALFVTGGAYRPFADVASIELWTRAVGHDWPLVGPFSRSGWYHPGPALFYVLALPYRLLGGPSLALPLGALAINAASVAGMAVVARRRGGTPLMLITLLGCALVLRSLGTDEVRVPWNPWVTVLPYGLVVFLTWAMTCGDRWALPLAAFVGSFVAQTHVGYVALALPLVAFGAAWRVVAHRSTLRRLALPGLATLGVVVVMWSPAIVEQLRNDPSNLERTVDWFRSGGVGEEGPATLGDGWRVVSAQYWVAPEWLVGTRPVLASSAEPRYVHQALAPVLLVVVALAILALWRRRVEDSGRLVAVWALASGLGVLATARTIGPLYAYRLGWTRLLGMVAGVIVAWVVWRAAAGPWPARAARALPRVALAGIAVLAVVSSVAHVRAAERPPDESANIRELTRGVVAALSPGQGEVVVKGRGLGGLAYAPALVLQLERQGIDSSVASARPDAREPHYYDGGPVRATLSVAVEADVDDLATNPDRRLVASAGDPTVAVFMAER
ncbi:MAG TPA: hypothetical protein VE575_15100 [Acidimicrobiales bacterium]|nr:hypothetical protein [Acidimicrobiales bacterium]